MNGRIYGLMDGWMDGWTDGRTHLIHGYSKLFVFLSVVSSNIGSVKSSLTFLRSLVVLIGERVEMNCSVSGNDVALWMYVSWNSSIETNIYVGRDDIVTSMKSRYKIDKRFSGQLNLLID